MAVHLWEKWYLRSAEATWNVSWRHHSPTTVPLSLGLGRIFDRPGGIPPLSFFVTGPWMVYRRYAPFAPQSTVNFGMTMAFPWFRLWRPRTRRNNIEQAGLLTLIISAVAEDGRFVIWSLRIGIGLLEDMRNPGW